MARRRGGAVVRSGGVVARLRSGAGARRLGRAAARARGGSGGRRRRIDSFSREREEEE
jgi:hypothetical protein